MRVPLTKETLEKISALRDRTGAGPAKILDASKADPTAPPGMTLGKISHITTGHTQTAYKDELEFVLRYLESLPVIRFKSITPSYIQAIKENIARTGFGPQAIISYHKKQSSVPAWLKSNLIKSIIQGQKGKLTVEQHVCIETLWDGTPEWIDLTHERLEALRAQRKRTGVGSMALFKRLDDTPKGLRGPIVESWLREKSRRTLLDWYEFIMVAYQRLPDLPRSITESGLQRSFLPKRNYLKTEGDFREKIKAEWKRTGVGPKGLTRHMKSVPKGFQQKLSRILSGRTSTAHKDFITLVLDVWAGLPDKK